MKTSTKLIVATVAGVFGVAAITGASIAHSRGGGHQFGNHHMKMGMHHNGRHSQMMDRFDVDGDGNITKAEIASAQKRAMAKHDADKDGALSLDEFQGLWLEHMQARMVRHFQHVDGDGDAKVTLDEMNGLMQQMMSRLDRNNDDAISKDEMRGRGDHRNNSEDGKRRRHGPKHD